MMLILKYHFEHLLMKRKSDADDAAAAAVDGVDDDEGDVLMILDVLNKESVTGRISITTISHRKGYNSSCIKLEEHTICITRKHGITNFFAVK